MFWCPEQAEKAAERGEDLDLLLDRLPSSGRFKLMELVHKNDYDANRASESLADAFHTDEILDTIPFNKDEKDAFGMYLKRKRKDFPSVAKYLRKSVSSCLIHYYSVYKSTDAYPILKEIIREKDVCPICGDGGDLICCEDCDLWFHPACLSPPLLKIPKGDWFCYDCKPPPKQPPSGTSSTASKTPGKAENGAVKRKRKQGGDPAEVKKAKSTTENKPKTTIAKSSNGVSKVPASVAIRGGKKTTPKKTASTYTPKPLVVFDPTPVGTGASLASNFKPASQEVPKTIAVAPEAIQIIGAHSVGASQPKNAVAKGAHGNMQAISAGTETEKNKKSLLAETKGQSKRASSKRISVPTKPGKLVVSPQAGTAQSVDIKKPPSQPKEVPSKGKNGIEESKTATDAVTTGTENVVDFVAKTESSPAKRTRAASKGAAKTGKGSGGRCAETQTPRSQPKRTPQKRKPSTERPDSVSPENKKDDAVPRVDKQESAVRSKRAVSLVSTTRQDRGSPLSVGAKRRSTRQKQKEEKEGLEESHPAATPTKSVAADPREEVITHSVEKKKAAVKSKRTAPKNAPASKRKNTTPSKGEEGDYGTGALSSVNPAVLDDNTATAETPSRSKDTLASAGTVSDPTGSKRAKIPTNSTGEQQPRKNTDVPNTSIEKKPKAKAHAGRRTPPSKSPSKIYTLPMAKTKPVVPNTKKPAQKLKGKTGKKEKVSNNTNVKPTIVSKEKSKNSPTKRPKQATVEKSQRQRKMSPPRQSSERRSTRRTGDSAVDKTLKILRSWHFEPYWDKRTNLLRVWDNLPQDPLAKSSYEYESELLLDEAQKALDEDEIAVSKKSRAGPILEAEEIDLDDIIEGGQL